MNYRHAYHAANFADVVKHAVLARILTYLNQKPAPYRVIDVHGGIGLYDLESVEAGKTGEWQGGLGRVASAEPSPALAAFLAPWLEAVRAENAPEDLRYYPGSPVLARQLSREQDRLVFNELHEQDFELLKQAVGRDKRVKCLNIDAYHGLKSLLPPPERRGVVLIDPPFEVTDEFSQLGRGIGEAVKRFAGGVFVIWYPIKNPVQVEGFYQAIIGQGIGKVLRLEQWISTPGLLPGLTGAGLIVINPPWTLYDDARAIWPELCTLLSAGAGSGGRVDWLVPE